MLELLSMMRINNCAMAIVGVFAGSLVALGGVTGVFSTQLLLAIAAAFLITGAGNVINDYADVEADKINRPKRPIPSGAVSKNSALTFSLILFVIGILCAGLINGLCLVLAIVNSLLLIAYSFVLQHKILIGNAAVGYMVGSLFLFGGAVFLNQRIWTVLVLMLLATLANIAREMIKDLEDLEGDKKSFLKKIASKTVTLIAERFGVTRSGVELKYKERTMIVLAILCLVFAVGLSALPYYYGFLKTGYLAIVVIADCVFISCIYSLLREEKKHKGFGRISKRLKIGMLVALVAFIAGTFI
jgi:geranylgeranylglycerol-phosphate geranylgeranyltransferase